MAHRRFGPPLDKPTVEFGVKGRTGPSPRAAGHVRWAGAGLGEGGGALHTDPVLAGQVLVIWGGVEGKVVEEGKVVGRGALTDRTATLSPMSSYPPPVGGAPGEGWAQQRAAGGSGAALSQCRVLCPPHHHTKHHTHVKGPDTSSCSLPAKKGRSGLERAHAGRRCAPPRHRCTGRSQPEPVAWPQ